MKAVLAIFCPPLYFLFCGKWGGFVINAFLYFLAFVGLFVLVLPGIFLWSICVIHAFWNLRKDLVREQAKAIAEEIVKAQNSRS